MRTTATAVKKLVETDSAIIAADADMDPFIEAANSIVTDVCVPLGYGDTKLELIERWLSAHFYAIRDPRARSESVEGISQSVEGATGLHLNHTRYGQQAMLLDYLGGLAGLQHAMANTKKTKIGVHHLGKVDDETFEVNYSL